jgi:NAD(P)-dependent dehydrogenase (short-subunit alcohol dehydrogenase family)
METKIWTADNIPSQEGKLIIITGANSGLGLEASTVLAGKGAHIIMAVRNLVKGEEAAGKIKKKYPGAKLDLMQLDLSDLQSIRHFSHEFHSKYSQLNVLINNAGVMAPAKREATKQNFEVQFGSNHLGHFLLTGLLLDIIRKTPGSRVVLQSSNAHRESFMKPDIHFHDLNWEKSYNRYQAYAQSKLANLLFAYELDRRFKANNIKAIATAAHPGWTRTNLQTSFGFFVTNILNYIVGQNVKIGTLPILRAATEENLNGAEYFGPTKMNGLQGYPKLIKSSDKSYDLQLAKKLWEVSEKLTGISYDFQ